MIKVTASQTAESLRKAQTEIKRKLERMVSKFSEELTRQASMSTPVGDADKIAEGLAEDISSNGKVTGNTRNKYYNYYASRFLNKDLQIEIAPGFHSGAWVYSPDQNIEFDSRIFETEEASYEALQSAESMYNLGETFYVGATGPGFEQLEQGYSHKAPNGIMQPTLDAVELLYQMDMKRIYEGA